MTDKTLKSKAIKFKGKDYVLIADRVNYFNSTYPKGSIQTELLSQPDSDMVVVKATVSTGEGQEFTGMSQAKWSDTSSFVNKTSALENAETSAVGRALAFMGIGVIDSIASIDEINKTTYSKSYNAPKTSPNTDYGVRHCDKHNVDVEVKQKKDGSGLYAMHMFDGKACFVNSEEEKDGFREKQVDYGMDNMMGAEPKLEEPYF